mgnify:CR=1 FL=1
MHILVMGGTRFVGKSLVNKLLSYGYSIDIFTRGNKPSPDNTNLIKGDRNNLDDILKIKKNKYDLVFDISGREMEQTKILLENIGDSFKRYVYVSSAGVYKNNEELPISENQPLDVQSRHKGKFEAENWLINQKIPFTSFRPTYIYGPNNYNKIENWFFERIFHTKKIPMPGDGSIITQLGHVSDLTDAMILSIESEKARNKIYNCSGKRGITIKGLIHKCIEICNYELNDIELVSFDYKKLEAKSRKSFPIRIGHYQVSTEQIRNDLNWEPKFDLLTGLKDSFENDFKHKINENFDSTVDEILFGL